MGSADERWLRSLLWWLLVVGRRARVNATKVATAVVLLVELVGGSRREEVGHLLTSLVVAEFLLLLLFLAPSSVEIQVVMGIRASRQIPVSMLHGRNWTVFASISPTHIHELPDRCLLRKVVYVAQVSILIV